MPRIYQLSELIHKQLQLGVYDTKLIIHNIGVDVSIKYVQKLRRDYYKEHGLTKPKKPKPEPRITKSRATYGLGSRMSEENRKLRDLVVKMYDEDGMSQAEIIKELGRSQGQVSEWIRKYSKTYCVPTNVRILIYNDIALGERDAKILADRYDVSVNTIYLVRKKYMEERGIEDTPYMTFTEIGEVIGLSHSRTSDIYNRAMDKIKQYVDENDLADELLSAFDIQHTDGNWNIQ